MPSRLGRSFARIGGSLMARRGMVGFLVTTGARTGLARTVHVGFVARPDGTVLIGAGSLETRGWVVNLTANPAATFTIRGETRRYLARRVPDDDRPAALAELAAKMGARAGRATWGPLFVLEPVA